jgi:adenosine/AMP kinase
VIGAIDQLQEAEQAVQALQDAGYAASDILLISNQDFIEAIQQRKQQTSSFEKAAHKFFISSDEGFPADVYLQQVQRGTQIVAVYTSIANQAQEIAQVLGRYHAHQLNYFSRWTTTNFPSPDSV